MHVKFLAEALLSRLVRVAPGLNILQSCGAHSSHWVGDIESESVVAVWASVFALEITHAQRVVYSVAYLCYRRLR